MDWKGRRVPVMGVIGGIGVVALLGGALGIYSMVWGIFLAFAIWIIGATLVNFLATRRKTLTHVELRVGFLNRTVLDMLSTNRRLETLKATFLT